jgi:hypothetical protein
MTSEPAPPNGNESVEIGVDSFKRPLNCQLISK